MRVHGQLHPCGIGRTIEEPNVIPLNQDLNVRIVYTATGESSSAS